MRNDWQHVFLHKPHPGECSPHTVTSRLHLPKRQHLHQTTNWSKPNNAGSCLLDGVAFHSSPASFLLQGARLLLLMHFPYRVPYTHIQVVNNWITYSMFDSFIKAVWWLTSYRAWSEATWAAAALESRDMWRRGEMHSLYCPMMHLWQGRL